MLRSAVYRSTFEAGCSMFLMCPQGMYNDVQEIGAEERMPLNLSSSDDLCHVWCACLAGQISIIKKFVFGLLGDCTGKTRNLPCLLVSCFSCSPLCYINSDSTAIQLTSKSHQSTSGVLPMEV